MVWIIPSATIFGPNPCTRTEAFERTSDITKRIPDKYGQHYTVALILGLSGRTLTEVEQSRLKEELKMNDLVKEIADESRLEAVRDIAKKLLALGDDVEKVAKVTGLPQDDVEEMRRNLH